METLWHDIRFGLRMLAKAPGFTAIAVLTLALGIGANTAIFSVVNGVLLKPLPYPEPQKLVTVWGRFTGIGLPNDRNWFSAPEFRDLQELNKSFSDATAMTDDSFNITAEGAPERVVGADVSPSLFSMLNIRPVYGRVFLPEEAQPGHDQEVLIGFGLWKSRFGSDPSAVGRTLTINGRPMTVVGILPAGFDYPLNAEMWKPLAFSADDLSPNNRGNHGYEVLARIKSNLTFEQALADMQSVTNKIIAQNKDYPYQRFNFAVQLVPLLEQTVGDIKAALWILTAAVGFVLLIACVNVASLLLARASAREREMAIRSAMGAGRKRLVRQLLTESVLLALCGGAAGLLLTPLVLNQIIRLGAEALPRASDVQLDGWALFFTMVVTLGTGILFGLAPALQASRRTPFEDLKEGGRSGTPSTASSRLRRLLVIAETAFSVVLLVGAGLLIRSFLRVLAVDPGFHADSVLTMRISLPEERYSKPETVRAFYREVIRRIDSLPGVQAAGATAALPLAGLGGSGTTTVDTQEVPVDQTTPEADWRPITPGYFEAMQIPLRRGRYFTDSDTDTGARVAIVDDTFAKTYWPHEDAVGKRVHLGGMRSTSPWMTIVGVVGHVHYRELEAPSRVQVYWPEDQRPDGTMSLAIRTSQDPLALTQTVKDQIQSVDPDQPIYQVRTVSQLKSEWVSRRFLTLLLVGLFAAFALVLAAIGIYGVMAHSVTRRTHEIGIRLALGANRASVLCMILGQGATLTAIGLAVGLVASFALTRLMSAVLYGISVTDPITFFAVAILLMTVALAACYLPARRAMRVDPMVALRYE
ncbi:MAG TPA: ABC transporter permease [Candidatus Acidoferrales bacterium]|nr:ABC transporter permease [Candidatus Acidoferrales bacterium]